jgi:hypothetical protein
MVISKRLSTNPESLMKHLVTTIVIASAVMHPAASFASAAPDLFGIAPGMNIAEASNLALAQLHATKFTKFHFSDGRPAGFEAVTDGPGGGRSEAFRADTPMSGTVTFLSRAVAYGKDVGPPGDDLLHDLQAKYGRYSSAENVGNSLTVFTWYYAKDWQIEGTTTKECRANTLKSDVSRLAGLYPAGQGAQLRCLHARVDPERSGHQDRPELFGDDLRRTAHVSRNHPACTVKPGVARCA